MLVHAQLSHRPCRIFPISPLSLSLSSQQWQLASDTRCPELIQQYHIDDEEKLQTEIDDAVEIVSEGEGGGLREEEMMEMGKA